RERVRRDDPLRLPARRGLVAGLVVVVRVLVRIGVVRLLTRGGNVRDRLRRDGGPPGAGLGRRRQLLGADDRGRLLLLAGATVHGLHLRRVDGCGGLFRRLAAAGAAA